MDIHEIKKILINDFVLDEIYVNQNDNNHYKIIIISDQFSHMTTLQRQKMVYKSLMEYILDGRIHSLSIQVFTLKEWRYECEFNTDLSY